MQVANGGLKAWWLIDVVDMLPTMCKQRDGIDMLVSECCVGNLIHRMETRVA